jgi:hypothetical protein
MNKIQKLLKSNYGNEIFYNFLIKELNQDLLIYYLNSEYLIDSIDFISNESFHKNYDSLIKKNFDYFNFQSNFLSEICESLLLSEIDNTLIEKNQLDLKNMKIEILFKIKKNIIENLSDPYFRYTAAKEYKKDIKIFQQFKNKVKDIRTIISIKDKEWIFNSGSSSGYLNNFNLYTEKNLMKKDILIFIQIVYKKLLTFVKKYGTDIFSKYEKQDDIIEEFLFIHELLLEFGMMKKKNLKKEEKLCFYLNIINVFILHNSIFLKECKKK